jgi:iron complex transport system substrate-binding protein
VPDAPLPADASICSVSVLGDELLALLVPVDRISCVSKLADDPEVSNVSGHYPVPIPRLAARVEPVLAARPDVVIAAPWNGRGFLELLETSGIEAVVLEEASDLAAVRSQLIALGDRLGASESAGRAARRFDLTLAAVDEALAGIDERPRVLAFSHSVVAGKSTTVDAMIERAGGVNAAAAAGVVGHRRLGDEQIVALDPDVLLLGYDPGENPRAVIEAYPQLARTRAARRGDVVVLAPRQLTTVSPYIAEGVLALARALHPERFPAQRAADDGE